MGVADVDRDSQNGPGPVKRLKWADTPHHPVP